MDTWLRDQINALAELGPQDWMALVLAAMALLVSLMVAAYSVRSERKMAKMATFERVHEQLVSAQTATGRRALFLHSPQHDFPLPRTAHHHEMCDCGEASDLWDVMNQALAWYDTLATYYWQRQVPRKVVLRAWYHPLVALRPHIYRFLDHKARQGIEQPWDALQSLLERAVWHSCRCKTCANGQRPQPQLDSRLYRCDCLHCADKARANPPVRHSSPWWISTAGVVPSWLTARARRRRAGLVQYQSTTQ